MNSRISICTIVLVIFLSTIATGCVSEKDSIVIGSKNFTEQIILGEMMSILIESNTDLKVDRRLNLGGTFICFNALKNGDIDMYPEYTGTGLTAILKRSTILGKDETYETVRAEFRNQFSMVWLAPFGFNNTYTITMREEQAQELSIRKISDLTKHEETLRPGFNHEFMERPDGYRGLAKKYGLDFKREPRELDTGLMYKAIAEREVDLICGFATDGRIPAFDLVMLEDDFHFFPPYYAAPLIRATVLSKHPAIEELLNRLADLITDEEMRRMNFRVDQQGVEARRVAKEFLIDKGLLPQ